jgi:2,3-bisphosphoglycerate-independent phosphoglycerate mutase
MEQEVLKNLSLKNDSKIILVVIDGLGGLPNQEGKSELEVADTPNLDRLARDSICGLTYPLGRGIIPGSGPAHLALFGYDPFKYQIGRGLLAALGINFPLREGDLTARANFATIDEKEIIIDRRAGRIKSEENAKLCELLKGIKIEETEILVAPIKEYRFLVVFRGGDLEDGLSESDPQKNGLKALKIKETDSRSSYSAYVANRFVEIAKERLKESFPANMILLRGFAKNIKIPDMKEVYKLNPCALATYPMYKGLARLVGMEVVDCGESLEEQIEALKEKYKDYDFFYFHIKKSDSFGEDGNFREKVSIIERFDQLLPEILELNPEVLVITGDHSTPSLLRSHSWHSLPILIRSKYARIDKVDRFSESSCINGGLGIFNSIEIMPLAMAHALKLAKFGA